ncbi:LAMI_0A02762g1_1 [Lachancea mirantina]|uniref:leucine--tRNA ligase n=1 Tax=Lachancea mirantina TaxID=1230905 RepID=A0A1G4IN99_9SACH|nr:LAMI_0A02762g1_1 [Lachancea mirantina]
MAFIPQIRACRHFGSGSPIDLLKIGAKWQEKVLKSVPKNLAPRNGKNIYVLAQFPYPSGLLHIGHLRVYTISDTLNRFYQMKGYDVIHPMGFDAFGLPAETAAVERGIDPADWTRQNINIMRDQCSAMLANFDWDREVVTCDPDYYRFTQQIFLEMFKRGLAYQKEAEINWDPVYDTVLANEQVDSEGRSWRSGAIVEKRFLKQWFLGITRYADKLNSELDMLTDWPEKVKRMQRHWIGRSKGTEVDFETQTGDTIKVFTTRVDTLFSVQYVALSLTHPVVKQLAEINPTVDRFVREVKGISEDSKKGMILPGVKAINPLSKSSDFDIPVFVAPYVLDSYGHGAVMGCPAHDERDFAFWAENMPSSPVLPTVEPLETTFEGHFYAGKTGILNSNAEQYAGMTLHDAAEQIAKDLSKIGRGKPTVQFKLRDWLISRQRYWGTPIPIIHCDNCGPVPVPENDLPVVLPRVTKLAPKGNPLQNLSDFVNTKCPSCGGEAKRETDTMDTFIDSSWYFFRFIDPKNNKSPFSPELAAKHMPVDLYIGGIEHAILHLLYARFVSKFLSDAGWWDGSRVDGEPFKKLVTQGMVHGKTLCNPKDGRFLKPDEVTINEEGVTVIKSTGEVPEISYEKMSKSKYNGVDPLECISTHGADVTRAHILFQAPVFDVLKWDDEKIVGVKRWLTKMISLTNKLFTSDLKFFRGFKVSKDLTNMEISFHNEVQHLLRSITDSFEKTLSLNTVISDYMKITNKIDEALNSSTINPNLISLAMQSLAKSIYPVAPCVAEEIAAIITTHESGNTFDLYRWPEIELAPLKDVINYKIVVNGKMRFMYEADSRFLDDKDLALRLLQDSEGGKKYLKEKDIKKVIYKMGVISFVLV